MRLTLVTIGNRMPDWVNRAVEEYSKRFPPELFLTIKALPPEKRNKNSEKIKIQQGEKEKILSVIPKDNYLVALDEHGKQQDTKRLSQRIQGWMQDSQNITFVIGGTDGLDKEVLAKANETWSLSNFTLPHGLARVVLVEQLYRAWTLLKNHPYHRE